MNGMILTIITLVNVLIIAGIVAFLMKHKSKMRGESNKKSDNSGQKKQPSKKSPTVDSTPEQPAVKELFKREDASQIDNKADREADLEKSVSDNDGKDVVSYREEEIKRLKEEERKRKEEEERLQREEEERKRREEEEKLRREEEERKHREEEERLRREEEERKHREEEERLQREAEERRQREEAERLRREEEERKRREEEERLQREAEERRQREEAEKLRKEEEERKQKAEEFKRLQEEHLRAEEEERLRREEEERKRKAEEFKRLQEEHQRMEEERLHKEEEERRIKEQEAASVSTSTSSSPKFLVVDDAKFLRSMLRKILEEAGYEVVGEAENGKEAIRLTEKLQPDVITMDITMPDMDGISATREIIAKRPQTKVIMCSASDQSEKVSEALKAGARDFISKPFDKTRALDIIKKAINM